MLNSILAIKDHMSQTFIEGRRVPVTKIQTASCVVTQIKNPDTDGYWALQLGIGQKKTKNVSQALQGHLKKSHNSQPTAHNSPRFITEIKLTEKPEANVGDTIKASDIFVVGDKVVVTGISKGKGFAGVVKRWHFHGGPRTHGQSDRERHPGSIGATTTPGRVLKGKHMAGRLGNRRVTMKNLQVVSVNPETGGLTLSGPVPGIYGGMLIIRKLTSGTLSGIKKVQIAGGEAGSGKTATN